jgi:hypothetical protein
MLYISWILHERITKKCTPITEFNLRPIYTHIFSLRENKRAIFYGQERQMAVQQVSIESSKRLEVRTQAREEDNFKER